jgi:hypothetical protein
VVNKLDSRSIWCYPAVAQDLGAHRGEDHLIPRQAGFKPAPCRGRFGHAESVARPGDAEDQGGDEGEHDLAATVRRAVEDQSDPSGLSYYFRYGASKKTLSWPGPICLVANDLLDPSQASRHDLATDPPTVGCAISSDTVICCCNSQRIGFEQVGTDIDSRRHA